MAAVLDVTAREAEELVAAGVRVASGAVAALLGGTASAIDPQGSFLVPVIEADGSRWVGEAELRRCEQARALGADPDEIAAGGGAADQLSLSHAARLSGVTTRYLRGLCCRYQENRAEIERAVADGKTPRRAYVVSYRGTKGQWIVKRGDLVDFLRRRAVPAVRVGYDLTLTTEKSLGVLGLLGSDKVRAAVLDAIEAGNDTGMAYLELRAASARRQGKPVLVRGWTVASFRHLTSRALDPFPHHHNVVANTVVDEHGTRRALDARALYWNAQEASALATAEMRHRLTETLGVRWRPSRSGGWEIDGISDEAVKEFSRRRNEIDDALAELEQAIGRRSTLDEVQHIVTSTRSPKEDVDPRQLVAGWWDRARRVGLEPAALDRCTGRAQPATSEVDQAQIFRDLVSPEDGICAGSSIFTRSEVLLALVNLPVPSSDGVPQPLLMPAANLERLADEFLCSDYVVELLPKDLPGTSRLARQPIFSTPEILGVQRRILDRHAGGVNVGAAVVSEDTLRRVLLTVGRLTDEQCHLVQEFCTSGNRVQYGIGRAGAGKTTTMRAAAAAWEAEGFRVIGSAVKGEAARNLAEGAGIPTETVAWFLARRDARVPPLDGRTVLIIDEASTLSDRDLDALLSLVERTGAAVRLIGDPAQHGAVAAGGMFRYLCESNPTTTPELRTTHRMTDPSDRAAAEALRDGRITDALDHLTAAGHLHVVDDDLSLFVGMLRRWWDARSEGHPHPMVDRRHRTRHQLNRLARRLLAVDGQLGSDEIEATGGRAFAVGDEVVARMAARHLHPAGNPSAYVRNGAVGTVVALARGVAPAGDRLRIEFQGVGTVDVPRGFFDEHEGLGGRTDVGIDHAYAVTSYSVQGATYDSSTSRIDEGASRSETYVDITRGRGSNHLFLTRGVDPLDGEHLPKAPPPPLVESVGTRLQSSGPERAAIAIDPGAGSIRDQDRVVEVAGRRAFPIATQEVPEEILRRLPVPVDQPLHLVRHRETAILAVAGYHVRWRPQTGRGPWDWAVGRPTAAGTAMDHRDAVVAVLTRYAVARATEELRPYGWDQLPPWVASHITLVAARGAHTPDWSALAGLYQRVAHHRDAVGDPDEADNPDYPLAMVLGPVPSEPAAAATRRFLATELESATRTIHQPSLSRP